MKPRIAERAHGPRACFPAIERKYGKPVDSWWMTLLRGAGTSRRHELVRWLMLRHGMVYGHADALVAVYLNPEL